MLGSCGTKGGTMWGDGADPLGRWTRHSGGRCMGELEITVEEIWVVCGSIKGETEEE